MKPTIEPQESFNKWRDLLKYQSKKGWKIRRNLLSSFLGYNRNFGAIVIVSLGLIQFYNLANIWDRISRGLCSFVKKRIGHTHLFCNIWFIYKLTHFKPILSSATFSFVNCSWTPSFPLIRRHHSLKKIQWLWNNFVHV